MCREILVLKQSTNEEHAQRIEPVSVTIARKAQVRLLFRSPPLAPSNWHLSLTFPKAGRRS